MDDVPTVIGRMDWDEYFMRMVYLVALKSKDPSSKIGAVLTKDNRVVSTGFNGFPIGVNDIFERYLDKETKYKYVVHAEDNCILTAARFGISTLTTTLYTQDIPCNECCKSIIQGGINEIVIHTHWPKMNIKWIESQAISKTMLSECGITVRQLNSKLGVTAYHDGSISTL